MLTAFDLCHGLWAATVGFSYIVPPPAQKLALEKIT